MRPDVSVVICTYNRAQSLSQTLQSLEALVLPPAISWELIVVDNNSKDKTKQTVAHFAAADKLPLKYVFESRPGLSQARNAGIANAEAEIIAFTDDDVTVEPDWISKLVAAFSKYDCIAIGGRVFPVWPGARPSWFHETGPYATPKAIVYFDLGDEVCVPAAAPYGANMAFRKAVFQKYGNFRVDLGRVADSLMGGEDIEFFERLKKGHEKILYAPDVIVHHPVTKDRLEKKYFERWCFNAARTAVRFEGLPNHIVSYFGLPRYYFRSLFENVVRWFLTIDRDKRFYYKLQVCILLGRIAETWQISRSHTA
jgi:glucosyl-dolichyl phosphate glucuronosyltransferase